MGLYLPVELHVDKDELEKRSKEKDPFDSVLQLCVESFEKKADVVKVTALDKTTNDYGLFYVLYKDNDALMYRLYEPDDSYGWELKLGCAGDILGSKSNIPEDFLPFFMDKEYL